MIRTFCRIVRSKNGNFGIMTALLAVPLTLAAGMALDVTQLQLRAIHLQQSIDAAALALAAQPDLSDADAKTFAENMIKANFKELVLKVEIQRGANQTTRVVANSALPTTFMQIVGVKEMNFVREATAGIAETKYEVALALDTTGSMEGGKLSAMKAAATTLIDELDAQVTKPANLKFALVPFSTFVNVGPSYGPQVVPNVSFSAGASWLDTYGASPMSQSDFGPNVSRFMLYTHLGHSWKGCVETRPTYGGKNYGVLDTAPDPNIPATLFVPAFAQDEPPFAWNGSSWDLHGNDYINDGSAAIRTHTWTERRVRYGIPVDKTDNQVTQWKKGFPTWTKPTQDNSSTTLYSNYKAPKGPNFLCETQPLMPLTSDYVKAKAAVDSLVAAGNTNILEGVAWGWRVLSSGLPFAEGGPESDPNLTKILVLLTDGTNFFGVLNNKLNSSYSSFGYLVDGRLDGMTSGSEATATPKMNAMTLAACTNAKSTGVVIYTILLEENNSTTSTLLQQCASKPEYFINVPDRSGLQQAFAQIKTRLLSTRLTN